MQDLIRDPIFYERYIRRNAQNYFSSSVIQKFSRNIFSRGLSKALSAFARTPFAHSIFKKRLLEGKIDIPYIEIALTTKCTLNCKSCNNMMQYFNPQDQYTGSLQNIQDSISRLLQSVDSVSWFRILGGEPLLFKELPKLVDFLGSQEKIRVFAIVTNGTIKFSDELLDALQRNKRSFVCISDYSRSPNLKVKLHSESIESELKKRGIKYSYAWQKEDDKWFDPGKIYKRGRTNEDIVKNFRACLQSCTNIIDGNVFVCPVASSLSRLKGLDEFQGDFINLQADLDSRRSQILKFYKQDFFKVCDYCQDMWEAKTYITPAVQLEGVLSVQKDD